MPQATLLTANVTSTPKTQAVALNLVVQGTSSAADNLHHSISLSAYALAASAATTAPSLRQLGIGIDLDKGDGTLKRLYRSELGPNITINGTLDAYGRTFSFNRKSAEEQSPFLVSLLRSLRSIKATGYGGVPGNIQSWPIFSGHLYNGGFDSFPKSGQFDCQDVSVKFNNIKLAYTLAAGSARTRLSVLLEILNKYGVPYGTLDLGTNDGGILFKPMSVGGDVGLLDWLRDYLTPIGRRLYFRPDGKIEVRRFDYTGPIQRTYKAVDLGYFRVRPPATNTPTSISNTGTLYSYLTQSGLRTTVQFKAALASGGTINAATSKQDHTSGVISPITPPANLPQPSISGRITNVFSGAALIAQHIETYGYYSARACSRRQLSDGTITYNASFDVYQYPDGTWHVDPVEILQKISDVVIIRSFSANGTLLTERRDVNRFVPIEMPIATIDGSLIQTAVAGFIADDGRSWWAGKEIFELAIGDTSYEGRTRLSTATETRQTAFQSDSNGLLTSSSTNVYVIGTTGYTVYDALQAPVANPGFYGVFGPFSAKRYGLQQAAISGYLLQGMSWSITYEKIDEQNYRKTTIVNTTRWANGSIQRTIEGDRTESAPAAGIVIVPGGIPLIDKLSATQSPGANTQTVSDDVRGALAQVVTTFGQNDFCEDAGEIRTVSLEQLRALSQWVCDAEVPLDWAVEEGDLVQVTLPEIVGDTKKFIVWALTHTLNGQNGDGRTQLTLVYWPPEIQNN